MKRPAQYLLHLLGLSLLLIIFTGSAGGAAFAAAADTSICAPGYVAAADTCLLALPRNANRNPSGDWTCNRGYYTDGDRCLAVEVPQNARLSAYGHTWVCNDGDHEAENKCLSGLPAAPAAIVRAAACATGPANSDGSCKRAPLPRHARRIAGSNTWLCLPGYQEIGGKCIPVQIPRFSHQSISRDDWLCNQGYQRADNRCVEIDVPDHATLGYDGNVWACNRGYYEIRGVCLPETDAHRALTAYGHAPQGGTPQIWTPTARNRGNHGIYNILVLIGIAAVIFLSFILFTNLFTNWTTPARTTRHMRMAYVPRQRGSAQTLAVWRPFGHRIDALTGAAIAPTATMAECRNCHAWYSAESVATLRHENEARCISCGRVALSYNTA